ncbi:MAG: HEAT repeat domain-containing protein [Bacteroidota bacterium]
MAQPDTSIEELIADLHGPDWGKRCDAARLLGQSGDRRAVHALLPDLKDPDWRVRRNAAQALGALKAPEAVGPLLQALNDRTNTVRERAVVALGRIRDPETIPVLMQLLLESENSSVGEAAYQALRKFGRKVGPCVLEALRSEPNIYLIELLARTRVPGQVELLIELAGHKTPHVRNKAIQALGKLPDPRATEFLIACLDSSDSGIQAIAIRSLGKRGATQAVPKLLALLQQDDLYGPRSGINHAVAEAFQQMSGVKTDLEAAFPGKFPDLFSITHSAATLPEVIGSLDDDHFQKLNSMLASMEARMEETGRLLHLPPEMVQSFADRTWRFGTLFADARDARTERIRVLIEVLAAGSPLKRTAAALTLAWYADAGAIGPLEEAVHDADGNVSRAARWALDALEASLRQRGSTDHHQNPPDL